MNVGPLSLGSGSQTHSHFQKMRACHRTHRLRTAVALRYSPIKPSATMFNTKDISIFCPQSTRMCFVWSSEQTANISLHNVNLCFYNQEGVCLLCGTNRIIRWL